MDEDFFGHVIVNLAAFLYLKHSSFMQCFTQKIFDAEGGGGSLSECVVWPKKKQPVQNCNDSVTV